MSCVWHREELQCHVPARSVARAHPYPARTVGLARLIRHVQLLAVVQAVNDVATGAWFGSQADAPTSAATHLDASKDGLKSWGRPNRGNWRRWCGDGARINGGHDRDCRGRNLCDAWRRHDRRGSRSATDWGLCWLRHGWCCGDRRLGDRRRDRTRRLGGTSYQQEPETNKHQRQDRRTYQQARRQPPD